MREVLKRHIEADEADIDRIEGLGALNFLAIDDLMVTQEGEDLDPMSIVSLAEDGGQLVFPPFRADPADPFLCMIEKSGRKWVVLTNPAGAPRLVMDADRFLRHALFKSSLPDPIRYCHRPIIVKDLSANFGSLLHRFKAKGPHPHEDVIEHDILLVWHTDVRRIITGADILGRLMRGIASKSNAP